MNIHNFVIIGICQFLPKTSGKNRWLSPGFYRFLPGGKNQVVITYPPCFEATQKKIAEKGNLQMPTLWIENMTAGNQYFCENLERTRCYQLGRLKPRHSPEQEPSMNVL